MAPNDHRLMMNSPAASNGVSTGIFLSPQGAGNSPLVRLRRIKILLALTLFHFIGDFYNSFITPLLPPANLKTFSRIFGTKNELIKFKDRNSSTC